MRNFLTHRASTRSSSSSQSSQSTHSIQGTDVVHHARSRRLEKSRSLLSDASSRDSSPALILDTHAREHPGEALLNPGVAFTIEWDNIWLPGQKLNPEHLGYRVKHASQVRGNRRPSAVSAHGADLLYTGDGSRVKIWLCKICHSRGNRSAAKIVDGYNHINHHLRKEHRIDVSGNGGLLPDSPRAPSDPWAATAAVVAGSARMASHNPWQEESLQRALVDWVILHDISFATASSAELRGLLTWNRLDLLQALPGSRTTISSYIVDSLKRRKEEIRTILRLSRSKVALSVDIWTSPNHLSFLGVVAHFLGMYASWQ